MLRRREYNFLSCTFSSLSRKRSVTQHLTEWMFGGSSKRVGISRCVFQGSFVRRTTTTKWVGSFLQSISEVFPYSKRLISIDSEKFNSNLHNKAVHQVP